MKKRLVPVFILALVVSGVATLIVYKMLAAKITAASAPVQAQLVIATKELQLGALISDADVRLADWSGPVPKGAATRLEDAVNRGVLTAIYEGEPILDTRLAPRGAGGGLAATIPVGMRAAAVRVNEVVGVAGFVVPGMRVDVIISGTPPNVNNTLGTLTRTVLQNIEVLSAGQKIEKSSDGKPETVGVVNLLVTPDQAEVLTLASTQTHIQLVLRNPLDTKQTQTSGTATASLFSGTSLRPLAETQPRIPRPITPRVVRPTPPPAPEKPVAKVVVPIVVEVFHGGKKSQAQFQASVEEKN